MEQARLRMEDDLANLPPVPDLKVDSDIRVYPDKATNTDNYHEQYDNYEDHSQSQLMDVHVAKLNERRTAV